MQHVTCRHTLEQHLDFKLLITKEVFFKPFSTHLSIHVNRKLPPASIFVFFLNLPCATSTCLQLGNYITSVLTVHVFYVFHALGKRTVIKCFFPNFGLPYYFSVKRYLLRVYFFCVHGVVVCCQKSFALVQRCQQLLSGFLAKGHLPRGSHRSLVIRMIMK